MIFDALGFLALGEIPAYVEEPHAFPLAQASVYADEYRRQMEAVLENDDEEILMVMYA